MVVMIFSLKGFRLINRGRRSRKIKKRTNRPPKTPMTQKAVFFRLLIENSDSRSIAPLYTTYEIKVNFGSWCLEIEVFGRTHDKEKYRLVKERFLDRVSNRFIMRQQC
jgi:hypothetical protein